MTLFRASSLPATAELGKEATIFLAHLGVKVVLINPLVPLLLGLPYFDPRVAPEGGIGFG